MDPGSVSGFCQIKGSLLHSEPIPGVSAPKPEPHPIPAGRGALGYIVPAVDELSTGEAPEFELAFTAFVASHCPFCRGGSQKSLFT